MGKRHSSGFYPVQNPHKYKGNVNKVAFRSSWELSTNKFLDHNPNILQWSSEEIAIPYIKPITGRMHRYFPDYYVKFKDRHGNVFEEIWEVKPLKETKKPTNRSKNPKTRMYEQITHSTNTAKWKSAVQFCNSRGWKFRLVTERQIFK